MASRDWPPKRTRSKTKNLEIADQRLGHTSLALGNIGRLVDDDGDSKVGKEHSAKDAEEVMRGLLADKMRQVPSASVVQYSTV